MKMIIRESMSSVRRDYYYRTRVTDRQTSIIFRSDERREIILPHVVDLAVVVFINKSSSALPVVYIDHKVDDKRSLE